MIKFRNRGRLGATFVALLATTLLAPAAPAQAAANPQRVQIVSPANATSPKIVTVACGGTDVLVGMGANVVDGQGEVLLTRLVPDLTTDSVTATAVEDTPVNTPWELVVWGICVPAAQAPLNLQLVSNSAAASVGFFKGVDVTCPGTTQTYGIGYALSAGFGQVAIDEVRYEPALKIGSVDAYTYNGFGGSWGLDTHVICGEPAPNMTLTQWTSAVNPISPKTESTPVCGGTTQVHGVGGWVNGALGNAAIATLNPRPQLTTAEITVRETGPYNNPWSVTVQAVCAD
ncbi:MAG TPA: hypothetical protein VF755_23620 [Catenuloplanes sp.]|jgi:hypothetical protein